MSEESAGYRTESGASNVNYGKYWAAIKNEKVLALLPMKLSKDKDFEEYRSKAIKALSMLGDVKSGELQIKNGVRVFIKRLTHPNRGKTERKPKEYIVDEKINEIN